MGKIILSICLIVKNEEKTLRRCLDSLIPIMNAIPTELIITDTGSTDSTVDIAREYTDKVLHFDWINDFAAARNFGIKESKGQWLMIIDADMWFKDSAEIIKFFKSDEHLKYSIAICTYRNLKGGEDLEIYSDSIFFILYKRFPGIKFEGKIHECIMPREKVAKRLNDICYHSGYDYVADPVLKEKKFKRNLTLLLDELKLEPENAVTLYHIINEYKANDGILLAEEYVEKFWQMSNNNSENRHFTVAYKVYCELKKAQEQYDQVLILAEEYLNKLTKKTITILDFYIIKAEIYYLLENFDMSIKEYIKYKEAYNLYLNGKLSQDISQDDIVTSLSPLSYNLQMVNLSNAYLLNGQEEESGLIMGQVDFSIMSSKFYSELMNSILHIYKNCNYYFNLPIIFETLLSNKIDGKDLSNDFIEILESYLLKNPEDLYKISKSFINFKLEHEYLNLQRLRTFFHENQHEEAKKELNLIDSLTVYKNKKIILNNIIFYLIYYERPINTIRASSLQFSHIVKKHPEIYLPLEKYLHKINNVSTYEKYIITNLWDEVLEQIDSERKEVIKSFPSYIKLCNELMSEIYKDQILTLNNTDILPQTYQFAFHCNRAIKCLEGGDKSGYINELKLALKANPSKHNFVSFLLKEFSEDEERKKNLAGANEFQAYAQQVKEKIKEIINLGMKDQAISLLDAYEKINGSDPELKELKEKANQMRLIG